MTSAANLTKLGQDALTLATTLVAAASSPAGAVPVLVADLQTIRDALAELVLLIPPIDAPALDPGDRAAVDADVDLAVSKS